MSEPAPGPPSSATEEQPPPRHTSAFLRALQLLVLTGVAGLLALLVWRVVESGQGAHLVAEIGAGKRPEAPQFTLPVLWAHDRTWAKGARDALKDGQLALHDLRGYPIVINFWASWCAPCAAEAPRFRASARAHAGRVLFLGIDVQDFSGDARRFLRKYKINFVSLHDGSGSTLNRYGLTGLPETYYLSARGRIVAHSAGEVSRAELEDGLARAVGAER